MKDLFGYFPALSVLKIVSPRLQLLLCFCQTIQKVYLTPSCPSESILYIIMQGKNCICFTSKSGDLVLWIPLRENSFPATVL